MRKNAQYPEASAKEQLALVQLPARMRRALRLFRKITGRTAVASVVTAAPELGKAAALSPPVHPRCAKSLRSTPAPPCGEQWSIHLRIGQRSSRTHVHTCPIGLRCSCVPIRFGGRLVGVAKLVTDTGTSETAFMTSLSVLRLVVSEACKDTVVNVLSDEVSLLRRRVKELQGLQATDPLDPGSPGARHASIDSVLTHAAGAELVNRALAHLQRHYHDPALTLRSIARTLECNPKYLTSRFSRVVRERMHTYLVTLRVSHACRLLVRTNQPVKAIAAESGFPRAEGLTRAFRTHVGVSPKEYRRIFAGP